MNTYPKTGVLTRDEEFFTKQAHDRLVEAAKHLSEARDIIEANNKDTLAHDYSLQRLNWISTQLVNWQGRQE